MLFTCVAPRTKSKGLPIGGPLLSKKLMLFTRVAPHTKSKGLSIGGLLLSKKLMLFTCVAPRTKSKGLLIGGPLLSKKLMFLTRVTPRTKSKGLPIGGPVFSEKKSMFFTCVAPRTKTKGLPIDGPHIFYYFQHVLHRVQKVRGSRLTVHTSSITFSTRFAAYKKQGAPDWRYTHLLLLSARASPRTKSKGLHRYVLQICYFINQVSKKKLQISGSHHPLVSSKQ
jgi:hypothetical protein